MTQAKPTHMRPILEDAIAKGELTRDVRKAAKWALVTIDDLQSQLTEARAAARCLLYDATGREYWEVQTMLKQWPWLGEKDGGEHAD